MRTHIHCSTGSSPHGDTPQRIAAIAAAGFEGVECWISPQDSQSDLRKLIHDLGLNLGIAAYFPEEADPEPMFEAAARAGALYIEAQVDGYWQSDDWIGDRTRTLMALGDQYAVRFFLETHRGRYTQDPRRTLQLIDRHPDLWLCGDFSHYASTSELRGPWPARWREPIHRIASRCGMVHARLNAGQRVQDPLGQISNDQRQEFASLWMAAARSAAQRGATDFFATTELLPPDYQIVDLSGKPVGDLWQETLVLRDLLANALNEATA